MRAARRGFAQTNLQKANSRTYEQKVIESHAIDARCDIAFDKFGCLRTFQFAKRDKNRRRGCGERS